MTTATPDVDALFREACRGRMAGAFAESAAPILDRGGVQRLLPHQDAFLLVDDVHHLDAAAGLIAASYDLARAAWVFAAHFPGRPMWPGVLQVEAIGQSGCVLFAARQGRPVPDVAGTSILGA